MTGLIDGINFHSMEVMKYWAPTASWTPERKRQEVQSAIFSGEYIGSRKMDGAFYKFIKDMNGEMELLGRSKSVSGDYLDKLAWVPQLQPFFDAIPNGSCIIGEIYFPDNEGSNHVTTIMGCLADKARARQTTGSKLHYYVFDVLAWSGAAIYKKPFIERPGDWICSNCQNLNFSFRTNCNRCHLPKNEKQKNI